ncbi:alpha/beta-hydrolase [Canariomyces notabilis]|uniref:Alpha/beta-hydrolase n=1 Tax=Canariomyces notabilis TaxID=2074819 RepID=A0AAN6YV63_9PEZI|nr:alpha/beta-hydrolase [Canariomyces arenarius]
MATNPIQPCCLRAFPWDGTPTGSETTLAGVSNPVYMAYPPGFPAATASSSPSRAAILIVHDLFGWRYPNVRLLADAYAAEVGATVYVPDFFGGESLPAELIEAGKWAELDLPSFTKRNSRAVRDPEIVACARAIRAVGHERVGAAGFCYGGWAVMRLASGEFVEEEKGGEDSHGRKRGLVDCVTAGHPTWLTKEDIDKVEVPVQMLAPEIDNQYTQELKLHTFTELQKKGVPFDYQHFPGVEHGCFVRGNRDRKGEREAMARAKDSAVAWFKQWLQD